MRTDQIHILEHQATELNTASIEFKSVHCVNKWHGYFFKDVWDHEKNKVAYESSILMIAKIYRAVQLSKDICDLEAKLQHTLEDIAQQ